MTRIVFSLASQSALWISCLGPAAAQEVLHEKPDQTVWPAAKIEQAAWLSGTWHGRSDDGVEVEESWVGPSGTMMAGVVLQTAKATDKEEEAQWSDHMAILSNGYTLALHYGTVWADFNDGNFEQRRLLRIEDGGCRLYFHAVTFVCGRDEPGGEVTSMTVYWLSPKDGFNPEPEMFTYRYTRVK